MKKFIMALFNWFINLFKRTRKEPVEEKKVKKESKPVSSQRGGKIIPYHNNRRHTNGRHIQYINMGGITRPIYHEGH